MKGLIRSLKSNPTLARLPGEDNSELVHTGASPVGASHAKYESKIITGNTQGEEDYIFGAATGHQVGTRRLVTLLTRTHASDSVTLDDANFTKTGSTITAIELDAANEFLLVEARGAAWEVIAASSGVVSVA